MQRKHRGRAEDPQRLHKGFTENRKSTHKGLKEGLHMTPRRGRGFRKNSQRTPRRLAEDFPEDTSRTSRRIHTKGSQGIHASLTEDSQGGFTENS